MANVQCFLLEPTGKEWASEDGHITAPLYRHAETGEEMTLKDAPVGAIVRAEWASWCRSQDDGAPLIIKLPDGDLWYVDGPAGNCTMPDDPNQERHHCWVRHGEPPNLTVDKNGATCDAGAGSIASTHYHGFLRSGVLEGC
ncbi:MAG: hypothetical protein ACXWQR_21185 [Ktedonobacterales bacterium]